MRWLFQLLAVVCWVVGLSYLAAPVRADNQTQVALHLSILPYHQCDSLVDRQIRMKAGCWPVDKYQPAVTVSVDSQSLAWTNMKSNSYPLLQTTDLRLTPVSRSQPVFGPVYSHSTESQTIRQTYQVFSYTRPPPLRLMV